jgi:hypothetical protein
MRILLFFLLLINADCFAQPRQVVKIAKKTSLDRLKENLYYLASDKMEGRMFASHGDTLASLYIADWFKKCNLKPAYENGNSYFQTVIAQKKNLVVSEMEVNGKRFSEYNGWINALVDNESLKNIPMVFVGYGVSDSSYNDFENIDVKGKAVVFIFSRGGRLSTKHTAKQSFANILQRLRSNGAAAAILYQYNFDEFSKKSQAKSRLPKYENLFYETMAMQMFGVSNEVVNTILSEKNITINQLEDSIHNSTKPITFNLKATLNIEYKIELEEVKAPNVIGIIEGSDPTADCIILSAHHDHDGKSNDIIYYGAIDNASGTVVIMEVATLMNLAIQKGYRPKRTIVFASFTGEERGLLGSQYFADNPLYPLTKTRAIYNIDMLGRVDTIHAGKIADSNYVYTLIRDSLNVGLLEAVTKANESVKLRLDDRFNDTKGITFLYSSDHAPFYKKGVPFIRTMCGMTKDYHQPTDTPDKINYPLLTKQTQLVFLTIWNMANK